MNPREHIGFAELSRFAGSVLRCLLRKVSILFAIQLRGVNFFINQIHLS
jgi:hypothetical protein